jgi:hypothetical protein
MGTTTLGKGTRATRAGTLVAGARKHFANGGQVLTFAGGLANVTVDEAVGQLKKLIDNRGAVTEARATVRDRVAAEKAQAPALVAFMNAFEALVRVMFGTDTAALADFGLQPHKRALPKTATEKAVAAAKGKATREARGVRGPKAKKAIVGNVTAKLVVAPATPPAGEPAVPAPEPAAAPGGATAAPPKG